ncbi:tetratricopeptide repeat protein [Sediminitomix flava]|uniref:Tetratricopeptide repeat protein n=1 Tax=Sediminitomix flava TaxID=379075 RepID=A0A315Z4F7_SEDFL|nr:tetratricopeptide repeat protein [Sediminitomix flava]PWJ37969.1 tetratricopeptide repeat protein [Sediminitomix flava]
MLTFFEHRTRHHYVLFLHLIFSSFSLSAQDFSTFPENSSEDFITVATNLRFQYPDSALNILKNGYTKSIETRDTLTAIQSLISLSDQYTHNADFGAAYDGYWEALLFLDQVKSLKLEASTYFGLAWLYHLYERSEEAKKYFDKSLEINKNLFAEGEIDRQTLLNNYYALAIYNRKLENTEQARVYLDSCRLIRFKDLGDVQTSSAFIEAELGYNFFVENQSTKALDILLPLDKYFSSDQKSYLVIYHSALADIYLDNRDLENAEKFYRSAIDNGLKYKSHQDVLPELYEKLSELLLEKKNYQEAYASLKEAKALSEIQYGTRSAKNRQFIEIKDSFRQEKDAQRKVIQEQKLKELEQEDKIWYLKTLISYSAIVLLLGIILFVYRHFRNKIKTEKKLMLERRKLEQEKAKEILEIKNKELTASTLQIIERDEMLVELKSKLKEHGKDTNSSKLQKLAKSIDINRSNNWKEFEARFVEVNGDFYKTLNENFPNLTQGDQKICALIKLSFDSKEMSKLLGISTESVHTTRYRLRKKLGLNRKDNLEEFIANLN